MNINFFKKSNKIILSILLLCITYSLSYAVTYNVIYDDECTTVSEYVIEQTQVIDHDDLCDSQKQFHNCYTFDIDTMLNNYEVSAYQKNEEINLYFFKLSTSLLKPPSI